jgi:hypothetical protein
MFDPIKELFGVFISLASLPVKFVSFAYSMTEIFVIMWWRVSLLTKFLMITVPFQLTYFLYWSTGQQYWEKKNEDQYKDYILNRHNAHRWAKWFGNLVMKSVVIPAWVIAHEANHKFMELEETRRSRR